MANIEPLAYEPVSKEKDAASTRLVFYEPGHYKAIVEQADSL